jgi:hypothetical protein
VSIAERPLSWLFLVHQLPPRPLYLRAKVRRRLGQVGAVPVKQSVYALPDQPDCLEDFQWIAQEAVGGGGEAHVYRASLVAGLTDEALQQRFRDAADARFAPLRDALARLMAGRSSQPASTGDAGRISAALRRQIDDAAKLDFFGSTTGREVEAMMTAIQRQHDEQRSHRGVTARDLVGTIWVTRRDPKIDRLSTAWLIRRFVDPAARFRFRAPSGVTAKSGERTFDMVGADFGHEADRCTFETFCHRLGLDAPGLAPVAEIVHDLDIKDGKFGRADAAGIQRIVEGLVAAHPDSDARVLAALPVFDALFMSFGGRFPIIRPSSKRPRRRRRP